MTDATTKIPFLAGYRPVVPLIGLALLAVMAVLYKLNHGLYYAILWNWMGLPYQVPFIDFTFQPNAAKCWREGVDVYRLVTCDPFPQPFNYSPLWLRMWFLPTGDGGFALGAGVVVAFILSLGFIPLPRAWLPRLVTILFLFSGFNVFGAERANVDILMFSLSVVLLATIRGGVGLRMLGYGAVLLGTFLKFYTVVLFAMLLRERPGRMLAMGLFWLACIGAFMAWFGQEVFLALRSIPSGAKFGLTWGAGDITRDFGVVLGDIASALHAEDGLIGRLAQWPAFPGYVRLALTVMSAVLAWRLAVSPGLRRALAMLPEPALVSLQIGAIMMTVCFYALVNIGYRGVFFSFCIPAIVALAFAGQAMFRWSLGLCLLVFWAHLPPRLVKIAIHGTGAEIPPGIRDPLWAVHEIAWWMLATLLLAVVIRFVLDSTAVAVLFGRQAAMAPATGN